MYQTDAHNEVKAKKKIQHRVKAHLIKLANLGFSRLFLSCRPFFLLCLYLLSHFYDLAIFSVHECKEVTEIQKHEKRTISRARNSNKIAYPRNQTAYQLILSEIVHASNWIAFKRFENIVVMKWILANASQLRNFLG